MDLCVSLLTNEIYAGRIKQLENGLCKWAGKKEDVTEKAIRAVFEYMYNAAEETGMYQIRIGDYGVMTFERNKEKEAE